MCGALHCHTWIFSFGIELLIFGFHLGLAAVVVLLVCRVWGEPDEEAATVGRMPTEEHTKRRAA